MGTIKVSKCTFGLITVAIVIFFLNGCSSTPKSRTLPIAQSTLASLGQDADIVKSSGLELRVAKDKLEQAEQAAKEDKNIVAERLAQEALINLKLAKAKAEATETKKTVKNMERSNATLRHELDRAHAQ